MSELSAGTVVFEGVSKRYRLGTAGTLRGALGALAGRGGEGSRDFWALKDVSFRVAPGESLGIIGPNGAGKTTALKLLSNITQPTSGRIAVGGRISSLIELGAGFHPELTGRENVFLNGAILGLSRREIQRKLEGIIAFSELERFIDTPVKRYSSGMYVRLGFAVAAHVEPDVLLVDEVLAVGDAAFRQRCMSRMESLRGGGTTLVFISHNMHQVARLCRRALLLMEGRPLFDGDSGEAISLYGERLHSPPDKEDHSAVAGHSASGIMITRISLSDPVGSPLVRLDYSEPLALRVEYYASTAVVEPIVKVRLLRLDGVVVAMLASHHFSHTPWLFSGGGELSVVLNPVQLASGSYVAEVRVADSADSMLLASGQSESFTVRGPALPHESDQGMFVPNALWSHHGSQP